MTIVAPAAAPPADSISQVDQQIQAILQLPVPPASVGNLQADVIKTRNDAQGWMPLRQQIVTSATEVIQIAEGFNVQQLESSPEVIRQVMLQSFSQQLTEASAMMQQTVSGVGAFRQTMDANASNLQGDLNALNQQIAGIQQQIESLNQQVQEQRARIQYYEDHPWKLILDGLTIVGLIQDLNEIISAQNGQQAEIQQMQQMQQALQPLLVSVGPLTQLVTAVEGVGSALITLNTAVTESQNALGQLLIPGQSLPQPVVVAELETTAQNLQQAAQIAREILQ